MKVQWLFSFFFLITAVASAQNDPYLGVFVNSEAGLSLTVRGNADAYEGSFVFQGKTYPFTGVKTLGMLAGEYAYEGQAIAFSLALLLGEYYLSSEGMSIGMKRQSAEAPKPGAGSKTPAPSRPAEASVSTTAPAAGGPKKSDPYGGFSFQTVSGWQVAEENGAFVMTKTGEEVRMGVTPHNYASLEEIRANVLDVQDEESQTFLKGSVQPYGSKALFIRFQGSVQGQPVILEMISMVSPLGGGGISVVGSGTSVNYGSEHTTALKSVANSVQFFKPQVSPLAETWKKRINGKQLLYLYTGNGLSDKISIDLCTNGQFRYYSNSSYLSNTATDNFSYAGQGNDGGSWRVNVRSGTAYLSLYYQNGSVAEYALSPRQAGNEVGLNGKRYFIQAAENCP